MKLTTNKKHDHQATQTSQNTIEKGIQCELLGENDRIAPEQFCSARTWAPIQIRGGRSLQKAESIIESSSSEVDSLEAYFQESTGSDCNVKSSSENEFNNQSGKR